VLGILKAGGTYLPLDPDYPAERLRFLLVDAGLALLLVGPVACYQEPRPEWSRSAAPAGPPASVAPSNHTCVIYTSGSTGRPKGVEVENRNAACLFSVTREEFKFGGRRLGALPILLLRYLGLGDLGVLLTAAGSLSSRRRELATRRPSMSSDAKRG
jgi:non-ribosomal peptide synthetase component F